MSAGARLESIEELYRTRLGVFLRTAIAIADSRDAGQDAVHDAFVSAVRNRRSYRGEGTLEAWVWPMVVRSAIKARRRTLEEPLREAFNDAVWSGRGEDASDLRDAVSSLPKRQKLMLFLRYYGDLDYQTIAAATGVRLGTVGAELSAARATLRRHLMEVPLT
jgi:RNA polymerase sigma factor (sigma-70 family)